MEWKKSSDSLNVKKHSVLANILFCLKHTAACYPPLLFWCLLLIGTNVALPVLNTFLPKVVIEKIISGDRAGSLIMVTLTFTISIAVLSGLKTFFEKYIYWHKFKMNSFYLRKVANKGMTTDYCNQENELFRKLQTESFSACNGNYSPLTQVYDILISLLSNTFGFTVYFGILTRLNPLFMLFLLITGLTSYFLNKQIICWTERHNKEKIGCQQKIWYISSISGDLKSSKDIRLYHMADWFDTVYNNTLGSIADWYKRYAAKVFNVSVCDCGFSLLREGTIYIYLLYLILTSQIETADFVLYFGVITGFSVWLSGILGQINALHRINLAFNYLRSYLDYPEYYQTSGGLESISMTVPKNIELRNVSYRYKGTKTNTLNHISLKIEPGEHLAVVGLNGAGKTTLVKLICGLCDPTEGEVLYDGIDVRQYNRKRYYQLFSAVFQQFSILPVTIAQIVAETLDENIDYDRAALCLRQAGLLDKILSLPKGIRSNFGTTIYDDGIEFSGGEIQKLLLARALYRSAPIMILDEPTSALDPISERKLYETYHQRMGSRSAVFISHRLASTRFCDRIVLLDHGTVIEEGTHTSLLARKGKYYELFEIQAKYYRENSDAEEVEL